MPYSYVGANPLNKVDPLGLVWEYSQANGTMQHVDDTTGARGQLYTGLYSGDANHFNNPGSQNIQGEGPIPQGPYKIGPEYNNKGSTGPATMNLTPDMSNPTTYTFGRSLFRIHGDKSSCNHCASEGCIISPHSLRDLINNSGDNKLWVVP